VRTWESLLKGIENEPSAPVDGPDGVALHTEANAGRSPDRYAWMEMFYATPPSQITQLSVFDPYVQETDREDLGLGVVPPFPWQCNRLNAGGIPIYLSTGWWDLTFPGYLIDVFNRLTVPKKLLIGPWNHGQAGDPELLRWFDYWLKGIDTGVMDEPPVHYGASKPSGVTVWKSAPGLPLPEALPSTFYLSPEPSGTISSVNDGTLACSVTSEPVEVKYDVDHSVSLGPLSRHSFYLDDLYINTPGLVARGSKCLTFTTQPLEVDIEITGWPVIDLEITTTSDRGAIVATLENVQADGAVAYMTEGFLNFAHRMERDTNLGYQGPVSRRYLLADLLPVRPGDPMRVRCELYPISSIVRAGDRIRLTLAGADEDNLIVPTMGDDATLSVSLNGDHASRLILPIVNPYMAPTALVVEGAFDGTEEISAFRRPEDPRQGTD
jgi:putative CocE/NonD family hydrolase